MAEEVQDLSLEWLRRKLVSLLEDASSVEERDHAACAKYADILFKMLPSHSKDSESTQAELYRKIREDLSREKQKP
jgi:hypothetical protein